MSGEARCTYDSMPPMQHLLWPALGFAVALIAVLALRWAVMTVFNRSATGPGALAAFLQAIRLPSLLWCGVMAFYVTIEVASEADVLPRRLTGELTTILQASIILSVTITLAGMVETLITRVGESRAFGVPVTGLARAASRLTILAVGFLVLLSALGIHLAPILTALGVGGLAVAPRAWDPHERRLRQRSRPGGSRAGGRGDAGGAGRARAPGRSAADRSAHPRVRRVVARLHPGLPGRIVRRPVPGPARAAQAHPAPLVGRAHRDAVPDTDRRASRGGWWLRSCAGARGPWRARRAPPA